MLKSNVQVLTNGWYKHQDIAALKDRLFHQTAQAKNHYEHHHTLLATMTYTLAKYNYKSIQNFNHYVDRFFLISNAGLSQGGNCTLIISIDFIGHWQ